MWWHLCFPLSIAMNLWTFSPYDENIALLPVILITSLCVISGCLRKVSTYIMVIDSILSSPVRRTASFRKQFSQNELGSWSTLLQRHRFLLTALALLTFLCTVYLYFAVTLGANGSCSGMSGTEKALCHLEHARTSVAHGKLKFL